jgi:multidrug resistance protein, MATE family
MGFLIIFNIVDVFVSLGLEVPLADHAASYARYMAGAFVFMLLVALARNALAAVDRGDVPVWVMVAMVPLNAFGNSIFMYGLFGLPEMELAGAGAASLLVAAFAAASLSAYVLLSRRMLPFAVLTGLQLLASPPSWSLVRAGLLTGATSLCETGVYLSSSFLMAAFAPEAVAAHAIVFRTLALTYVLVTGVGQAVTIRLAHAMGSGRRSLRDGVVNASLLWVLLLLPTWMLVLNIGPAWALGVLQQGNSVEPLADLISGLSPLAGVAAAALAASVLAFGILRAHQDVLAPALLNLTGYWGIGFSLMVVLAGPAGYGATGVWTGLAVGSLATAAGSWLYVHARGHMRPSTE